jgi:CheY-like chemotaxis protein
MSRPTILHVDDDPNDVILLQHACKKAGIEARLQHVPDGDEAMAYLEGRDAYANREEYPLPHLVLLDLKMPRLSGFDVLAWLRSKERLRWLPVVVLSSSNHDVDVKKAYQLGANSYLIKPVAFEALVDIVKSLYHYWTSLNIIFQEN